MPPLGSRRVPVVEQRHTVVAPRTRATAIAAVNFGDHRLPERFWSRVAPCPMSGCWLWTGGVNESGYGMLSMGREHQALRVHRVAFASLVGAIADGLDIDHLCRVRICCNPLHLEPVARAVNLARSPLTAHARKSATHCGRGHEFTVENTIVRGDGARTCRACGRDRAKTYTTRLKERSQ